MVVAKDKTDERTEGMQFSLNYKTGVDIDAHTPTHTHMKTPHIIVHCDNRFTKKIK